MKITKWDKVKDLEEMRKKNMNTLMYWKTQMRVEHVKHINWQR